MNMKNEVLDALRNMNKLLPQAKADLQKMGGPRIKVPEGVFECTKITHDFDKLKGMLCVKRSFQNTKFAESKYDGNVVEDIMWLHTPGAIAMTLRYFISIGAVSMSETVAIKNGMDFVPLVKKANTLTDTFICELKYNSSNGKDYANITIIEVKENLDNDIPGLNEPVEPVEEAETVEEITETDTVENDIIDDFVDDFAEEEKTKEPPFYNDDDPTIPDLPLKPVGNKGAFEKYKKQLKSFCAAYDLEIPGGMKGKTADVIVDLMKDKKSEIIFSELSKAEIKLLKNVGITE